MGWNFAKLIQVGHHIAERHPDLLAAFGGAVRVFDRHDLMMAEDQKGSWGRRRGTIRTQLEAGAPEVAPNLDVLPLLRFLFPEVARHVDAYRGSLQTMSSQGYGPLVREIELSGHEFSGESREIYHEWNGPEASHHEIELQIGLARYDQRYLAGG